jgi:hypothetical protein
MKASTPNTYLGAPSLLDDLEVDGGWDITVKRCQALARPRQAQKPQYKPSQHSRQVNHWSLKSSVEEELLRAIGRSAIEPRGP